MARPVSIIQSLRCFEPWKFSVSKKGRKLRAGNPKDSLSSMSLNLALKINLEILLA